MIIEAIFNILFGIPIWLIGLLNIPDVPNWGYTALGYLETAMTKGVHLVSWLFPNAEIWASFWTLSLGVCLAVELYTLYRWATSHIKGWI